MKRFFTLVLLFIAFTVQAQDLKSLYIALPDSLSPLLTKVNRQDFGDFLSSNMKAEVNNRFGNTSEMLKLTEDYLEIKLTTVSCVEMKLLPVNDSINVICVAKTYQGPVKDTHLAFFSTEWEELDAADFIRIPQKNDFFIQPTLTENSDSLDYAKSQMDMDLVQASLTEKSQTLSFSYTVPEYLDEKTAEKVRPYLRKTPIIFQWKEGHFVMNQ